MALGELVGSDAGTSRTIICRRLNPKLPPSYYVTAPVSSPLLTRQCTTRENLVCAIELEHEKTLIAIRRVHGRRRAYRWS